MFKSEPQDKTFTWLRVTTLASGKKQRIPLHKVTGVQLEPV